MILIDGHAEYNGHSYIIERPIVVSAGRKVKMHQKIMIVLLHFCLYSNCNPFITHNNGLSIIQYYYTIIIIIIN